jgi:hypothetical protein
MAASEEELCRIKGIQNLTAAKIEWVLGTGSSQQAATQNH